MCTRYRCIRSGIIPDAVNFGSDGKRFHAKSLTESSCFLHITGLLKTLFCDADSLLNHKQLQTDRFP